MRYEAYHDYYIHQAGKGYPVFAGRRYQRGHGPGSIFGGLFKAAMPLLIKGTKTLEREALKTGLNIAGDVVQGINIKQTVKSRLKSTDESLLQKAMDTVGPPGQRVLKRPAKRKKTRRWQTKQRNTSNDISDMNGTCTSQLMRMHEIRTEFEVPPTQTSVAYGYWEQKGLTSALTNQGPYEFAVSRAGDDYIDLANTYPFVEAQIMDNDDTALDGGGDVGSVNLWMHSLFSDVSVSLNGNLVSPPTSLYPYRAYIEILLSCQRISINGSHVVQGCTGTSG